MINVLEVIYVDPFFTIHSYTKNIHRYALAMFQAGKLIPADIAGSLIKKGIKSEYSIT